ncbi:MAG: hypothetical protein KGZ85_14235 [Ignavibacterium sp.]|nr:hypothetical protein [Ignavibacterium sp.]
MLNNRILWDDITPFTFQLSQNYPNPFRERTNIKYCVAYKTKVKIKVYDENHNVIQKLVDEEKEPGTYEIEFNDERNHNSGSFEHEILFYILEAGDYKCEKKMELIK